MKLLKPILAILCVSISASAQTLTADRLNFNVPATGAVKSATWGKYGVSYFSYDFGVPHHDDVLCFGWNCGGPEYDANSIQWHQAFESYYTTSEGRTQSEFYFTAGLPNGGFISRPFSIDFYHDTGQTQVGVFSQSFVIGNPSDNNPWVRFVSSPTAAYASFVRDSRIDFSGNTREYFITSAGTGLMGKTGNVFKLFTGGITGETLNIFEGSDTTLPLTINLGTSDIRANNGDWEVTGSYSGFKRVQTINDVDTAATANKIAQRDANGAIDVSAVKINGVKVVGAPCDPIDDITDIGIGGIGENGQVDHSKTINKILQCLRQHGLLAE